MLEPNGRQILKILGKDDPDSLRQGILLPQHMPDAIAALEQAVAQDEAARQQRAEEARDKDEPLPHSEAIPLRLRATPFIAMLQRCHRADKEVVWGV